jgi:hypothetical protein
LNPEKRANRRMKNVRVVRGRRGHVAGLEQMVNADRTSAGNSQEAKQ